MIVTLSENYTVAIPEDVLTQLELDEGDPLDISIKDGCIIITPTNDTVYLNSIPGFVESINEESNKPKEEFISEEDVEL